MTSATVPVSPRYSGSADTARVQQLVPSSGSAASFRGNAYLKVGTPEYLEPIIETMLDGLRRAGNQDTD